MKVKALHVWYVDKRNPTIEVKDPKTKEIRTRVNAKRIRIPANRLSIVEMKLTIARALSPMMKWIEYYYVVVEVEKADGEPGFRTVIPKTLVA